MSERAPFLKLILAAPGWRVASVRPIDTGIRIDYETIVAWCETEDDPGAIRPISREGECERSLTPLWRGDGAFLAVCEPGETIDPADPSWADIIKMKLDAEEREWRKAAERIAAQKKARGGA